MNCICCPVSPWLCTNTENSDKGTMDEEPVDESRILEADGFNGEKMEMSEDAEPGHHAEARPAKSPSTPKLPSAKEIAMHNLTHAIYRSWCPFCVAGRRSNSPHRRSNEERTIPLLSGDFAFIRTTSDDECLTVFVVKVVPQRVVMAIALD